MATMQVQANGLLYTVAPDVTNRYQVLVRGSVVDALGGAPSSLLVPTTDYPGLTAKALPNGMFCLAGYAERVFTQLTTALTSFDLRLSAAGYREATMRVSVPQNATFPIVLPTVSLMPLPVRIQGRVMQNALSPTPIVNARVGIRNVALPGQPAANRALALRRPLQFAHASGVTVNARPAFLSATVRRLETAFSAAQTTFAIAPRNALGAGMVLRFGSAEPYEYGVIANVAPQPANLAFPGEVTLTAPLSRSYAAQTEVRDLILGGVANTRQTASEGEAGEGVLILNGALAGDFLEVLDGTRTEYHAPGALTDSNGYYGLDGVARLRTIPMEAVAGLQTATFDWQADYRQPVSMVDFRL